MKALRIISAISVLFLFASCASAPEQAWRARASNEAERTGSDISAEVAFGREVASKILGRYGIYENEAASRYVNLVGQSLARNAGSPETEFRFAILDTDEVNAYAAPGGYVFITKGALKITETESELAMVLAHEISHVTGRHIVKELNIRAGDDSALGGAARLIGGATDTARLTFAQAVDKAVDMLFSEGYKRADESEADGNAVVLGALSEYSPGDFVLFLMKADKIEGGKTQVLDKTHPPVSERVGSIRETIRAEGAMPAPAYGARINRFKAALSSI